MKENILISPITSEMIALCYNGINASIEYARGIADDPQVHASIRNDFMHVTASLKGPVDRIDRRIPKETWQLFKEQLKENDSLRLENIKRIFSRMLPAQQEMLELAAEGIYKKELEIVK